MGDFQSSSNVTYLFNNFPHARHLIRFRSSENLEKFGHIPGELHFLVDSEPAAHLGKRRGVTAARVVEVKCARWASEMTRSYWWRKASSSEKRERSEGYDRWFG